MQDGDKAAALTQRLKDLGMPTSEMPEIVYGADGVVAVSQPPIYSPIIHYPMSSYHIPSSIIALSAGGYGEEC